MDLSMKILNVMQCTNLGGMEQASFLTMKGLIQRGHSCRVISLNPIGALAPLLNRACISSTGLQYRGKGGLGSLPEMYSAFREEQADALIMTGHNVGAMLALGNLCKKHRILAIHFHHEGVKPRWQWHLIYQLACQMFQAITFPSDFIRDEAISIYPPVERIGYTVRNGVELPALTTVEAKEVSRKKLGIPIDAKVIGNAGWLIPRKRYDVFLETAAIAVKHISNAVFVIAGDGPEMDRLKDIAQSLGITEHILWIGWQTDMKSFYSALDVLLFNSDWDAMGMTSVEAMAYSIPVIASVVHGGLCEVLDNTCGYLIHEHNIQLLAQQLQNVLLNVEVASALGTAARQRIAETHSLERNIAQIEQMLGVHTESGEDR